MKFRMLFVAAAMLVCSMVAFGQGFSAALYGGYSEDFSVLTPLANHCGGDDWIADGVMAEIRQDVNNNGATDDDPLATVGAGVGESNYNTFPMNGCELALCGMFSTTANFVSNGALPLNNRFWVRVVGTAAIHRSPVFIPASGPSNIYLPTCAPTPPPGCPQWTCEVVQQGCTPTPGPIVVQGVAPQYNCLEVCAGSQTEVVICGCGPLQPPLVVLLPGCDRPIPGCTLPCPAGAGHLVPLGFGPDGCWHYILVGDADGCVCLGWDGCEPPACEHDDIVSFDADNSDPLYAHGWPAYFCADVCEGIPLTIRVCSSEQDYDPAKPPFVEIQSDCNNDSRCFEPCEPGAVNLMGAIPVTAWVLVAPNCWALTVFGVDNGCICIGLEGFLSAELSSFTAIARSASVEVAFATLSETDVDHFEVYRALKGHEESVLCKTFEATNSASGHEYSFVDSELRNGTTYVYSLRSVDVSNNRSDVLRTVEATPSLDAAVVTEYAIYQNYPNPFNPTTQITFDVLEDNNVTLKVFNATGQEVATVVNGSYAAGRHTITFDAANLTSGLYFYSVKMGDKFTATKKMLLVK